MRTHYDNLQVSRNASPEVIKGAYKYLSQKWHPDKNPEKREVAERNLKIINEAYEVLSDPVRRAEHDEWIAKKEEELKGSSQTSSSNEAGSEGKPPPHKPSQEAAEKDDGEWERVESFYEAALVGCDPKKLEGQNLTFIRFLLFTSASIIVFILVSNSWIGSSPEEVVNGVLLSLCTGWGGTYLLLESSRAHRDYVKRRRYEYYIPRFKASFISKKTATTPSGVAFLIPPAWFGYYGIIWPLIGVMAVFLTADFLLLAPNLDVLSTGWLVTLFHEAQNPIYYMFAWLGLTGSSVYLLIQHINRKLRPFIDSNTLDTDAIYKTCGPKTWRAVLWTFIFLGITSAPRAWMFPERHNELYALEQAKFYSDGSYATNVGYQALAPEEGDPDYVKARKWFEVGYKQGDATSANNLGIIYLYGNGVQVDYRRAWDLFLYAEMHGEPLGSLNLGEMSLYGQGTDKNVIAAENYLKKASDSGITRAKVLLGGLYQYGDDTQLNLPKAIELYTQAAEQGDVDAQNALGSIYEHEITGRQNIGEAIKWYTLSADQSDARGQYSLCNIYLSDLPAYTNFELGIDYCELSAAQEFAPALVSLGWAYLTGEFGVKTDYGKAIKMNTRAYELGNGEGATNLGYIYHHGLGVTVDYALARSWFEKAISEEHHSLQAEYMLANLYYEGKGGAKDIERAADLYRYVVKSYEAGNIRGLESEEMLNAKYRFAEIELNKLTAATAD